jgi:hypothetical protein
VLAAARRKSQRWRGCCLLLPPLPLHHPCRRRILRWKFQRLLHLHHVPTRARRRAPLRMAPPTPSLIPPPGPGRARPDQTGARSRAARRGRGQACAPAWSAATRGSLSVGTPHSLFVMIHHGRVPFLASLKDDSSTRTACGCAMQCTTPLLIWRPGSTRPESPNMGENHKMVKIPQNPEIREVAPRTVRPMSLIHDGHRERTSRY